MCHHCHRLVHASQYETPLGRAIRRAQKAEQRLGNMSLPKPKGSGMWLRTYARILDRAWAAASQVDEAVVRELERLLELAEADEKRMIRNRPSRERKV